MAFSRSVPTRHLAMGCAFRFECPPGSTGRGADRTARRPTAPRRARRPTARGADRMLTTVFGESDSRARRREETRVGFSRSLCAPAGVPPTRSSAQWLQCDLQRNPRVPGVRYSVRPPSRGRASHRRTSSACPRHRHARLSGYRYPGLRMCPFSFLVTRQIRYTVQRHQPAVACSVFGWAWGGAINK